MSIFCQKCGGELKNGILICSKCGFENKNLSKKNKYFKKAIFILSVVILCIFGFANKDFLFNYYQKVKTGEIIVSMDADIEKKNEFQRYFYKYIIVRDYYIKSKGYALGFAGSAMQVSAGNVLFPDYVEILDFNKLSQERLELLDDMEKSDCFLNNEVDCKGLKEGLDDIHFKIARVTAHNYIGSDSPCDINIPSDVKNKNEKMAASLNASYPIKDVRQCMEKIKAGSSLPQKNCTGIDLTIQNLYKIGASFSDKNKAPELIGLVDLLRQSDNFTYTYEHDKEQFESNYCSDFGNMNKRCDNYPYECNLSEEDKKIMEREDKYCSNVADNWVLAVNKREDGDVFGVKEANKLNEDFKERITQINDYISVVNGDMGMSLPFISDGY